MQIRSLVVACVLTSAGLLPLAAGADTTAASPAGTPPPEIYHVVTTALCARVHEQVRPAVAMILQNDQKIAKSPPLFAKYERATVSAGNGMGLGDSMYAQSPETSMTLQQMSYLVIPIARNIIAAQTMLDDAKLVAPTGNPQDDAKLAQIKAQLLQTIAYQNASLDLINGFVQTLQMGEVQHAGQEYLGAIQGGDMTDKPVGETPNQYQDPNSPGLPPNPYALDVSQIPGLAVGYNGMDHILEGINWLQAETQKREDAAGKTIGSVLLACGRQQ